MKRVLVLATIRPNRRLDKSAIYGLSPAADMSAQFRRASQIVGVYQAEQTTNPGIGVAPAAMSSIFAAQALQDAKNI
jgi:phytoene dehydrogenase-like protein